MELQLLDTNLHRIKVIDVFNSLIWTDRYFGYGDFEIATDPSAEVIQSLKEDYYLSLSESDRIMIIEQINLKTDTEDGREFIVKGRSLESILERRIIVNQTVLNGGLQNGILRLLNENVIAPADNDRKIANFVFQSSTDPIVLGSSAEGQFRGEELYDVIESLCKKAGVGFKITLNTSNQFVFQLYAGVDRSYNQITNPFVAFSPDLDNLANSNYVHSKVPFKTVTLVGGEGEGSDQKTQLVSLPTGAGTGLERREKYTDASWVSSLVDGVVIPDEEYAVLLINEGLLGLLESLPTSYFEGKIDPTTTYTYGNDFFLGDIVQVENEYGLSGTSRMTELIFSEDISGTKVFPTFEMIE